MEEVDDTFCILRKGSSEELLHHLNGVRLTIKFTLEQEEDGKIPFLDTLLRKEDGSLEVSVCRKPMHTDQYLRFKSHHPTDAKGGVVICFHNTARGVTSSQDNLQKEVDHLARALKQNAYPANFIHNGSAPPTQKTADTSSRDEEQVEERGPLVIPCVTEMSEDIKHICRKFNIRVVFKFRRTLRSVLAIVKDTLPIGTHSNVVYCTPCSCSQVYIGDTRQRLETRQKDACERGMMVKSAVAEHAWRNHNLIH